MAIQDGGRYKARACGEVVIGESGEKKTPFIEFYFSIVDGENKGGKVRWTSYFTERSSERTIESLVYCGWKGDDLSEFADHQLHGLDTNDVEIETEIEKRKDEETGEEKSYPRVKWVNKLGGHLNVQNAMTKEAASSFADRMKGLVLKVRDKSGAKANGDGTDFPHGANAPDPQKQAAAGGARKSF